MLNNMSLKMKFLINTLITVLMLFVILGLSYFSGNKTASNLETLEKVYISGMVKAIKATDGYTYFQNSVYAGTVTDFSSEEEFETLLKEVEKEGNKSLKEFEVLSKDLSSLGNKEINSLIKKTMILQKSSISNGIAVIETYYDEDSEKEDKQTDFKAFQKMGSMISQNIAKINLQLEKSIQSNVKKSVEYSYSSLYLVLGVVATIILLTLIIMFFLQKTIMLSVDNLGKGLNSFFSYLNGEKDVIEKIKVESHDELGIMSEEINKNIENTEEGINKDTELVKEASQIISKIEEGIVSNTIISVPNNKGLKALTEELNRMIESIKQNIGSDLNNIVDTVSKFGELDFSAQPKNKSGKVEVALSYLGESVSDMLKKNDHNGLILESGAVDMSTNFKNILNSTNQQAASLEETAASIEEITGSIRSSSVKSKEMSELSFEAKTKAEAGHKLVIENNEVMNKIVSSVGEITQAITVIDQIAFQTNILSLNAAVEAATAGEHGKGFAVVAQEVRNLAAKSAEAADEIKKLVNSSINESEQGKSISDSIQTAFEELIEKVGGTVTLVEEVNHFNKEQLTGMEQINQAASKLDHMTQNNAQLVNQANETVEKIRETSSDIKKDLEDKSWLN